MIRMEDAKKRSDSYAHEEIRLWGVLQKHPLAPTGDKTDCVYIAPTREIAERWVSEGPNRYLVTQIKPAWEYVGNR